MRQLHSPTISITIGQRIGRIIITSTMLLWLIGCASTNVRTATDSSGQRLAINGKIVLIEPDIELSEVMAGGVQEPRKQWSEAARRLYPIAANTQLKSQGLAINGEFEIADNLDPSSTIGQLVRLNEAVSFSILAYSQPGNQLATKKDPKTGKHRMDWTLGPNVKALRDATGADYGLFTFVRDSYTSGGRAALRVVGFLLLGGDVGGGLQLGVSTLVDLRTGQVVWFNLLVDQTGDLRDAKGADETASKLLKGLKP